MDSTFQRRSPTGRSRGLRHPASRPSTCPTSWSACGSRHRTWRRWWLGNGRHRERPSSGARPLSSPTVHERVTGAGWGATVRFHLSSGARVTLDLATFQLVLLLVLVALQPPQAREVLLKGLAAGIATPEAFSAARLGFAVWAIVASAAAARRLAPGHRGWQLHLPVGLRTRWAAGVLGVASTLAHLAGLWINLWIGGRVLGEPASPRALVALPLVALATAGAWTLAPGRVRACAAVAVPLAASASVPGLAASRGPSRPRLFPGWPLVTPLRARSLGSVLPSVVRPAPSDRSTPLLSAGARAGRRESPRQRFRSVAARDRGPLRPGVRSPGTRRDAVRDDSRGSAPRLQPEIAAGGPGRPGPGRNGARGFRRPLHSRAVPRPAPSGTPGCRLDRNAANGDPGRAARRNGRTLEKPHPRLARGAPSSRRPGARRNPRSRVAGAPRRPLSRSARRRDPGTRFATARHNLEVP